VNYYEHHLGDYDAATAHLSWLEDMAYTRLLRLYYRKELPVPTDVKEACRLVRAITKEQKAAVESVLKEFFALMDDGWHQKRCDEDVRKYQQKVAHNREVGKLGGRPKKVKTQEEPTNNPPGSFREPKQNPPQTPDTRLNSVSKDTDGEPASEKSELWAAARSLLQAQGLPAAQCGSFVGKLVKQHGNDVVLNAVRAAVAAQPQEAREYLTATCLKLSKAIPDTVKAMTEPTPKWATKAGFSDRFEANNAGCFEKTAHMFRDGKRIEETV
jgi:uncharacterized protein YdaU (DUF1376 family)